ncbi:MAG: RES family NAD+ phosphorylase [Pseudomonadota bacterium]|jgi:hypothetical protein|nr:RES family NAD+ phosphorylase [Pseudomonadota bacterium]
MTSRPTGDHDQWQSIDWEKVIRPIHGTLYRLVESQEQIATRQLVDTLEEQALLEEMLDAVKPPYPENIAHLHYLLKSPFRYPPLKWGSRFGRTFETSIFYGGCSVDVTLVESAYYRFIFWHSMQAPPPKPIMRSVHTLFSVDYKTQKGVKLQSTPFDQYHDVLKHPSNYRFAQSLGTVMRSQYIEVFEYCSARTIQNQEQQGICVGLFTADPFCTNQPKERQQWFCDMSAGEIIFKAVESSELIRFYLDQFLLDGVLPMPA